MSDVFFEVNWDVNEIEEPPRRDLVPNGEYELVITGARMTVSKAGQKYLKLTSRIITGEHKGRFIFDNIFAWYQSDDKEKQAKVQRINQSKINTLRITAGVDMISNESDFIGILYAAKIKIQKDKTGQYEDRNVIDRYLAKDIGGKTTNIAGLLDDDNDDTPAPVTNYTDSSVLLDDNDGVPF